MDRRVCDLETVTRRQLFQRVGLGVGGAALGLLLKRETVGEDRSSLPAGCHHAPRARRVIYMHFVGAPSHLDLFDYKPELAMRTGELCPEELFAGKRLAFIRSRPKLLGTPYRFERCGRSGLEISELLPHLRTVADELALVKTLRTDQFNHAPAQMFLLTGFQGFGRPSIGSWVHYGLGSANEDLPGFVVLNTGQVLGAGNSAWGSGFLPTVHQGVEFRNRGDAVLYLSNPHGVRPADRRRLVQDLRRLNSIQLADVGDPEIATRIRQYEMAYRMQTSVPELMDIGQEPPEVHEMYGTRPGQASFANHCLLARRLVERGVRFVQLFDQGWDHHGNVFASLPGKCKQVDRPIAALIRDLKNRGLLDDTLVVWSSEFGRTPMAQVANGEGQMTRAGRDHHREAYSVWLAGGGVRPGFVLGATDDLGYAPVEDPVHVHDFNATILHLLGIDHERLTFTYQGRRFRLTDVHGRVIEKLLA